MKNKLLNILFFVLLLSFTGCGEETISLIEKDEFSLDGNQPVEFLISEPNSTLTRASETQRPIFIEGDVIHVEATFKNAKGNSVTTYAALKLMSGKWQVAEGSSIVWPFDAVSGLFKAFYFPKSDGVLRPGSHTDACMLSEFDASLDNQQTFDLDPLTAVTEEYRYGHAVSLNFTHLCTYLTFTNLDPGVSDYFWLVNLINIEGENDSQGLKGLNNACYLELSEDNKLSVKFFKDDTYAYLQDTYISGKAVPYDPKNGTGTYAKRVKVSFFLEPGNYSRVELRTNTNNPYLSLTSEETKNLQAHTPYEIDAVKSKGITYTIEDEDDWSDEGPFEVKVKEFIEAAVNGQDYSENDVPILEAIPNGVRLVRNVKFPENQIDYDEIWGKDSGFTPNIGNGSVFEGDYHYISNIKQPLFQYNSGTIQNLGLKDVDCEVISKFVGSENDYRDDRSRRGGLCQWNREGGLIRNIRIEGLKLTVNVDDNESTHTHNAGGICGVNIGTISDINFKGVYNVTIQNNPGRDIVDSEITLGGITGQNMGNIYRVSPLDDKEVTELNIINKCTGNGGVFNVGGAVGYNTTIMENISLPNVNVDCSDSEGYQGYTGGLVGRLRGSSSVNSVTECTVGGSIKVGHVSDYGDGYTDSYLYTGGLAGSCLTFIVSDSATTCDVDGKPAGIKGVESNARYATGGVFGAILTDNNTDLNDISNITGWNTNISGPAVGAEQIFTGSFAGIVPQDKKWEEDYSTNGVTVKNQTGLNQIGVALNIKSSSNSENGEISD